MNGTGEHTSAGCEDAALVRYMHGESAESERQTVESHIERCAGCRERLEHWRADEDNLARILNDTDFTPSALQHIDVDAAARLRRSRRARRRMSLAAGILVVVAAATVEPMRAVMVEGWSAFRGIVTGENVETSPAEAPADVAGQSVEASPAEAPADVAGQSVETSPAEAPADVADRAALSFAPTGAEITMSIAQRQAGGTVTLRVADKTTVTAIVVGGGDEELVVTPDGLLVRNTAASTASYELSVPSGVERVTLRVGTEAVRRYRVADAQPGGWTVDLSAGGR